MTSIVIEIQPNIPEDQLLPSYLGTPIEKIFSSNREKRGKIFGEVTVMFSEAGEDETSRLFIRLFQPDLRNWRWSLKAARPAPPCPANETKWTTFTDSHNQIDAVVPTRAGT